MGRAGLPLTWLPWPPRGMWMQKWAGEAGAPQGLAFPLLPSQTCPSAFKPPSSPPPPGRHQARLLQSPCTLKIAKERKVGLTDPLRAK